LVLFVKFVICRYTVFSSRCYGFV